MVSRGEMQAIIEAGGHMAMRKYDGQFATVQIGGAVIIAEFMRGEISGHHYTASDRAMFARCPAGWYAAITLAAVHGENVLGLPTRTRWGILSSYVSMFPPDVVMAEVVTEVAAALAAGAEGVCAHDWGEPWGNMACVKVNTIYTCRVSSVGNAQSVGIVDAETGQDRGNVALRGGKCDRVRAGSIIRVDAMGETDAGKLRQAVPCREWLVQF